MTQNYKTAAIIFAVSILAIVIFNFIRKFILNVKGAANSVNSVIVSQTAENEIAVQTGLTPNRIAELKQAASLIAIELETGSNLSWWDNLTNISEFSEIKKLLIGINSTAEMQVLSSFYKNIFTLNGNLYQDIAQEFTADEVATIPLLSSIA
jgi:hypothetical protein